ncbi:conserved protein of unknown function [Limnospira indica PCC 8005]|uniref:Uncharacterized protein n=1 Tax=Limnospira indica PCC 8005 TaxID=376219 RepID=A0A9P1KEF2_9CYAN|nr:conserved protein of unknown function [Limnospira indica PCC 8005]
MTITAHDLYHHRLDITANFGRILHLSIPQNRSLFGYGGCPDVFCLRVMGYLRTPQPEYSIIE